MILPFSILPLVLASSFLFMWAFIVWLKFEENLDATRHDWEAPGRVVFCGGDSAGRPNGGTRETRDRRSLRGGARGGPLVRRVTRRSTIQIRC